MGTARLQLSTRPHALRFLVSDKALAIEDAD